MPMEDDSNSKRIFLLFLEGEIKRHWLMSSIYSLALLITWRSGKGGDGLPSQESDADAMHRPEQAKLNGLVSKREPRAQASHPIYMRQMH
jgi:hypothetical protein